MTWQWACTSDGPARHLLPATKLRCQRFVMLTPRSGRRCAACKFIYQQAPASVPPFCQAKGLERLCCAALQVHRRWLVGPCRQSRQHRAAAIVFWLRWGSKGAAGGAAAALPLLNPLQLRVSLGQHPARPTHMILQSSVRYTAGVPIRRQHKLLPPLVHLCQNATDESSPLCCAAYL